MASVTHVGFTVKAQQQQVNGGEVQSSRRAMLSLVATGLATGSFVQVVLIDAKPIKVGPPPPPSGRLRMSLSPPSPSPLIIQFIMKKLRFFVFDLIRMRWKYNCHVITNCQVYRKFVDFYNNYVLTYLRRFLIS